MLKKEERYKMQRLNEIKRERERQRGKCKDKGKQKRERERQRQKETGKTEEREGGRERAANVRLYQEECAITKLEQPE